MTHLSPLILQGVAEGELPPEELREAMRHVDACVRCESELEAYRSLSLMLSEMPRFAPSAGFSEAVMARVQIASAPSLVPAWIRRLVPRTRAGWAALLGVFSAPVIAVLGALVWVIATTGLPAGTVWKLGIVWAKEVLWDGITRGAGVAYRSGIAQWMLEGAEWLTGLQSTELSLLGGILAMATPMSVWVLYRLLRTPVGSATHAH